MQILCTAIIALLISVLLTKGTSLGILDEYRPGLGGELLLWLVIFLPIGIWGGWQLCEMRILAE